MANLKLSQLPMAAALTGTEILPVVQAGQTRSVTVAAVTELHKGSWQTPILSSPWTNYGDVFATAAYRKDGNRVQLRGRVTGGQGGSSLFTLPLGFRPPAQQTYVVMSDGTSPTHVDIKSNGEVTVAQPTTGVLGRLSLDALAFFVD